MEKLKINHLAVLASFILLFLLGFAWYEPIFGDPWKRMVGLTDEIIRANPPGADIWISNIIATLINVYVLAWLFIKLGVKNGLSGAFYGFIIAFSFIFLSHMITGLYAKNPYGLAWITGGFYMVGMTLVGFILGAWTKKKKTE